MALPGGAEYAPFLGIGLLITAVTFATLLPFLILSSASPSFRDRLKALLHLKAEATTVMHAERVGKLEIGNRTLSLSSRLWRGIGVLCRGWFRLV